ncbi:MAG: hypothetical protein M1832_000208 [Thelocarpon impressellum]|nr:MAG: hypothetical protein M1832_000208 [Thelocarpon impressellum]
MAPQNRQYELVLFGATGYTGKLTAEHITTHLPTDLKWAVAGRSEKKLSALVDELRPLNPDRSQPGVEVAELNERDLDTLAKKTKLLISVVGPYSLYGTPVVEACARNGTHYLDVTGETPWVKEVIERCDAKAKANGAILIPQIGVESSPADLLSWLAVTCLREKLSVPTEEVIFSTHEMNATPSGGTSATIISMAEVYGLSRIAAAFKPWALSPTPGHRYPRKANRLGVRQVPELGTLTTAISGTTDRSIVHRSWGLLGGDGGYGPRFHFSPYMRVSNAISGALIHLAITFGMVLLALAPVRWLLRRIIYAPGTGPDKEATSKEYIEFRALAVADTAASPGAPAGKALARFRYDGGMYYVTGVFLAEAALVLLRGKQQDVPAYGLGGGVLTPATLGRPFVDRLRAAGVTLEVQLLG